MAIIRANEPTQLAVGDDAVAAGMALVAGTSPANTLDTEDNITRDYIANGHVRWKPTLGPLPLPKGGTGVTTANGIRNLLGLGSNTNAPVAIQFGGTGAVDAATARTNLGVQATVDAVTAATPSGDQPGAAGKLVEWGPGGSLGVPPPTAAYHPATKAYVDSKLAFADAPIAELLAEIQALKERVAALEAG